MSIAESGYVHIRRYTTLIFCFDHVEARLDDLASFVFFFNDTATTEIYTSIDTLSLHDALPISIRSAVEVVGRARAAGVPVVAVDTPTAVDLSSGEPSDPAVLADLTVTFHRPKTGLLTKRGSAHAGKILVAPIGIPAEADRG